MIIKYAAGDLLLLKKPHPCGGKEFLVLYAGSDVKILCRTCGRERILPRVKLDRAVKEVVSNGNQV